MKRLALDERRREGSSLLPRGGSGRRPITSPRPGQVGQALLAVEVDDWGFVESQMLPLRRSFSLTTRASNALVEGCTRMTVPSIPSESIGPACKADTSAGSELRGLEHAKLG